MKEAAIDQAIAIIIAVPNPFEAQKIIDVARELKPDIKVLVRARNEEEEKYFIRQGADLVAMGPREVGRRMVGYLNDLYGKGSKFDPDI